MFVIFAFINPLSIIDLTTNHYFDDKRWVVFLTAEQYHHIRFSGL